MGIIIRESFKQSIVKLTLALFGALATLLIYPLSRELYGILGFVINTAVLLLPIVMIGLGQASIRFFPYHNDSLKSRRKYFNFLIRLILINSLVLVGLFLMFKENILSFSKNPDDDFTSYLNYVLPGAILFGLNQFLVQYLSNFKNVTLPAVWQNLYRIGIPTSFVLVYYEFVQINTGIWILLAFLSIGSICLIWLSITQRSQTTIVPLVSTKTKMEKSVFYKYYLWAFASSIGAMVAFRIDVFMISSMLDFKSNGDYMIAMFMTNVIAYPIQSVLAISTPIISQAWKDNDLDELKSIYLKGSRNLLFIGATILFVLLVAFQILPILLERWEELKYLQMIIFVLGVSKLFDMLSSVNGMIIQHSEWFRYNTYFLLLLTVLNITFNYILIGRYQIIGAAYATLLSLTIFNLLKSIFLYIKIGFHPYHLRSVLFFITSIIMYCLIIYFSNTYDTISSLTISVCLSTCFLLFWLLMTDFASETRDMVKNLIIKLKS